MSKPLLPTRFLFRFAAPCKHRKKKWTAKDAGLTAAYRLPSLAELDGREPWADVRAAWNEQGVMLTAIVHGKSKPFWCDPYSPERSDGLHVWIDTRDVHTVHRAGRFCHRFAFLPQEAKKKTKTSPAEAFCMPINRAKEQPSPAPEDCLQAVCQTHDDGYSLHVLIPAEALTGFDPVEHPRLGFTYAVIDRELGEQTFAAGGAMPYQEDPSLWATLELAR